MKKVQIVGYINTKITCKVKNEILLQYYSHHKTRLLTYTMGVKVTRALLFASHRSGQNRSSYLLFSHYPTLPSTPLFRVARISRIFYTLPNGLNSHVPPLTASYIVWINKTFNSGQGLTINQLVASGTALQQLMAFLKIDNIAIGLVA